jgi:general secretion pathway protein A
VSLKFVQRPNGPSAGSPLTYEPFFGLSEKPFSLNADSRFVYESPSYVATRDSLLSGIRRREGLLVVTGQIGTGKTTLCREALRGLGRNTYSSLVPDPFASREDLLKTLLVDFGVVSVDELTGGPLRQASRTELGFLLAAFLDKLPADAHVVVVIDEAQNLSLPLIEEMRILSDTFGARGRMQIVFVGQPELHAKLKLPEMRQVDQRVCGYHRLAPIGRDAVAYYIHHRLHVAGAGDRVLFPPPIVETIHLRTGGVPRLINRVCDRALQLAYERRAEIVDREILDTALIEVGAATLSPTWDSILFEQPAKSPAARPAPPVRSTPAPDDTKDFSQQVNDWVAQDLAPPPPPERRPPGAERKRETATRAVRTNWPRDVRSEPYINRLLRRWAKRAAIGLAAIVVFNVAMESTAVVNAMLAGSPLPTPPAAPVVALPGLAPIDARPPQDSGEYLVAVGVFTNRDRADQITGALTRAGLPAIQRPMQLRRQPVQQVVLGPYFSQSDVAADLRRLQALGGYDDARVIVP